jgi:hypothetical protein
MATERTGLVAGSEYTRQAQVGDCRVGQTSRQIVTVEQIGQVVRTPDDLYAETNLYITESRRYFPSKYLSGSADSHIKFAGEPEFKPCSDSHKSGPQRHSTGFLLVNSMLVRSASLRHT